jgi:hypothetical protein
MMKSHVVCTIGAWLLTAAAAAVGGQTAAGTQTPSGGQAAPSPSTPPTHPTMREAPTTTPDNAAAPATPARKKGGTLAEAKQACKNMSGEVAQKECMKKAEDDFKKTNPSGAAPSQ